MKKIVAFLDFREKRDSCVFMKEKINVISKLPNKFIKIFPSK